MTRRTLVPIVAAVAGLLLVVTAVVLLRGRGAIEAGGAAEQTLASSTPSGTPARTPGAALPSATPTATPAPVLPASVRIPKIGVAAPVVPVGVTATGELDPPERVATVGWYRYSPPLRSAAGSTVLAGHVDDSEQGRGAFFRLGELRPGDTLSVVDRAGRQYPFRVVARQQWPKTAVPLDRLFALDGAYRLTLITCGGNFDPAARSYRDNIAVTAVPA
jgi:sortase (surface protein transpeptidase)